MKSFFTLALALLISLSFTSCEKFGGKDNCESGLVTYYADDARSSSFEIDGVDLENVQKMEIHFYWGTDGGDKKDWGDKEGYDKEDCGTKEDHKDKDWETKGGKCYPKSGDKTAAYKFVAYSELNEKSLKADSKEYDLWYEQGTYSVDGNLNIVFYPKEGSVTSRQGRFDADKSTIYLTDSNGHENSELKFIVEK